MTYAPRVSILVTVFNREHFLADCLDSIIASKWTDWEAIVVDDGSTDGSVNVVETYALRDSRIRLYQNEKNLGDYANRMQAAKLANGHYLKYVDSDDLIYPHGLEVMVKAMEREPDAALGLSHSLPEDVRPYPWRLTPEEAWQKEFLGDGCMGSGPTGAIIRRDAFFEAGGFGDWGVLSDADLWYRMSARWPLVLLPPGLVWWRRHPAQEFTKDGSELEYLSKGFHLTMKTLADPESPLSESDRNAAVVRARQRHSRRLLALGLRGGHPKLALRLIKDARLSAGELFGGLAPYR